jgi:predicted phage baseplate assembly protein
VIVHGNVALATHGETVQQLLGSGRASAPFQRFTLAHDPLTYLQTGDPSGADSALEVRVNDALWEEVPTLYGAGSRDRAYALRTDEQGKAYVQFGDGEHGARLPSGSNNVRAKYRKGLGAAGNVEPGALAQLLDRPLGVKGVGNPAAASGGVDPEAEESARASIPLGVRTIGRAVSLLDYEDFARAFSGVVKAHAAVLPLRAGRTVVVTVAFDGGDRLVDLGTSLRTHGDPHVEVLVLAGTTQTFRLALKVGVDPAFETDVVLAGVESALRAAYSFAARGFTEPVFLSRIVSVAHTVAGVVAVDIDLLYTGTTAGRADRLLAQQPAVSPGGTAIPAGLLELDPEPLDGLEAMPRE